MNYFHLPSKTDQDAHIPGLFAIADGHGTEKAKGFAIHILLCCQKFIESKLINIENFHYEICKEIAMNIKDNFDYEDSGTTLSLIIPKMDNTYIFIIGDSPIYRNGEKLKAKRWSDLVRQKKIPANLKFSISDGIRVDGRNTPCIVPCWYNNKSIDETIETLMNMSSTYFFPSNEDKYIISSDGIPEEYFWEIFGIIMGGENVENKISGYDFGDDITLVWN